MYGLNNTDTRYVILIYNERRKKEQTIFLEAWVVFPLTARMAVITFVKNVQNVQISQCDCH